MSLGKFILWFFKPRSVSRVSKKLIKQANDKSYLVVTSDDIGKKRALIVEYDSIMSKILSDLFGKNTVGENLKKAKNRLSYSDYNSLWFSHKIRNRIIHEIESKVEKQDLNMAINNFKKILIKF
ncbi:hypothetical protein KA001_00900 [Patescibacteria group bacterium]|nr:hypothetical protein [Patescibacteria group bacterium]